MLGPQLQYQSLKTVLLHMDANTRFRISTHMQSVRNVEKTVPLKLKHLEMSKEGTVIDDTSYIIEVVRYHPEGSKYPWPTEVGELRRPFDFDEFGFIVDLGKNVLLPGDIPFQLEDDTEVLNDTEEKVKIRRDSLKWDEKAVEILTDLKSKGGTERDYIEKLDPSQETMETSKQIKRFEYTKKQYEAVKQLNGVFFGGRSEPILVQLLDLTPSDFTPLNWIYRLPTECRLHASQVNAIDFHLAHRTIPLLIGNSENLDTLCVFCIGEPNALRNQIARSARKLVIDEPYGKEVMEELCRDLPNQEILFVTRNLVSFPMHHDDLINVWLSGDRPVGASFWITLETDKKAREILRLVAKRHKNAERINRCVTIPRDDSTKVNIFYAPIEESSLSSYDNICKWTLKVEIVNV